MSSPSNRKGDPKDPSGFALKEGSIPPEKRSISDLLEEGFALKGGSTPPEKRSISDLLESGFAPKESSTPPGKGQPWARNHGTSGGRRASKLDAGRLAKDSSPDLGLAIDGAQVPLSLRPTMLPQRWTAPRRRVPFGMIGGLACVMAAAFIVGRQFAVEDAGSPGDPIAQPHRVVAPQPPVAAVIERTRSIPPDRQVNVLPPQLVLAQAPPLSASEALRLGMSLDGPSDGAVLLIGGLAPGSTLSVGRSIGGSWWRLSAAEVEKAILTPPRGFVGIVALTIELRLSDDTIADRKSMRLEWAAPSTVSEPAFAGRQLDANEIASLLKRGEQFVAKGDLAAARSLFERAAETRDARAAFALAETYDPIVLLRWGERGFAPDIAAARSWYERAQEFGSSEASQRLQTLVSLDK